MTITGNTIDNNALADLVQQAAPRVVSAIEKASDKTGVDFAYLMEQAAAESSFDTDAKAGTSSATGLYQFIESTWLNMVKKHGHKYGMGHMANQIDSNGRVDNPAMKKTILALRNNPEKAALMAAEFAAGNKKHLENYVDGEIGATELYFAHFMGASGATGFLNAMKEDPMTIGADIFPKEANANRNVFYNPKTGAPRTLSQIYDFFDKKFTAGDTEPLTDSPVAAKPTPQKHYNAVPIARAHYDVFADSNIFEFIQRPLLQILQDERQDERQHPPSLFSGFNNNMGMDITTLLSVLQA